MNLYPSRVFVSLLHITLFHFIPAMNKNWSLIRILVHTMYFAQKIQQRSSMPGHTKIRPGDIVELMHFLGFPCECLFKERESHGNCQHK